MDELAIKIEHVSKEYRLGAIGGGTLKGDLQSWWARKRGKEDPNSKIGARTDVKIGERFLALDDISLTVKKGEALGIIGRNGAGKSTLLKLLSRVTAPTKGTISYDGRIASMLEVGTGFHPEMTGRENIYLNGTILGMTRAEIDAKIENIIEFSEVRQFIDTPVKRYSSGMYVKLAFSVAAHLDSEIMIMDEVLAVGDMAFQKKCLTKMREAAEQEGRTVLYVSHNMNTIRQLCDRCVVLDRGHIVFDGDVEEAIGLYIDSRYDEKRLFDYERSPALRIAGGKKTKLITAEYIGKEDCRFAEGEKMAVKMTWQNAADIDDLCLRVELREKDRTIIGTAFIYEFYSGKQGETSEAVFSVDTSELVPGRYASTYTLFQRGAFGANVNLDNVIGLNFEIVNNEEDITWDKKHWGCVRFPPIEMVK